MEYKLFWKRITEFKGVTSRQEYWIPVLVNAVIIVFLDLLSKYGLGWDISRFSISYVWYLVILVPTLALSIRRLHDIGKSGWYFLTALVPVIGWIAWIIWACTDSTEYMTDWKQNDIKAGYDVKYPGNEWETMT